MMDVRMMVIKAGGEGMMCKKEGEYIGTRDKTRSLVWSPRNPPKDELQ